MVSAAGAGNAAELLGEGECERGVLFIEPKGKRVEMRGMHSGGVDCLLRGQVW